MIFEDLDWENIFDKIDIDTEDLKIIPLFVGENQNTIKKEKISYIELLESFLQQDNSFNFWNSFFSFPINSLKEHISLSRKKVKLILERRFYKSLYNLIKKDSEEIEDKIVKFLFQGIENKYSPEKCLSSL